MAPDPSSQALILAVEDDAELLELLVFNLEKAGYRVVTATTGREAISQAQEHQPDLILLDVMLPELSGIQAARRLRSHPATESIPIIMVTAKAEESDELVGLEVGADDYITKPYSIKVLTARMQAVLRRAATDERPLPSTRFGPLAIDPQIHQATVEDDRLHLTVTEFKLLEALIAAEGKVLSRSELMSKAMGPGVMVTQRTIDVHITALRRKLGAHGSIIQTVRGVGYQLDPTLASSPAP